MPTYRVAACRDYSVFNSCIGDMLRHKDKGTRYE